MAAGEERHHVHHLNRIPFCADFSEKFRASFWIMRSLRQRSTMPNSPRCTWCRKSQVRPRRKRPIAAVTERLNKLIPPEGRKTLKIKTAVRIGKPYWQIIQLAVETQIDLVTMGSAWPWHLGSCGVWFDSLSGDAVGMLPRSRRRLNRVSLL